MDKPRRGTDNSAAYKIPRSSFIWLLLSICTVLIPHLGRMPVWLSAICGLCLLGRLLIYQGRMSFPGPLLKTVIVAVMVVMVLLQYGRDIFSTDATVAVLLTGITLKLLEMQRKRDVLLVLYLCYFTVIAEFIYSQSIPVALFMSLAVLLITSALLSLNQSQDNQHPWRTLRLSGMVLLQSVPLMLVFFVVFPRIDPLWSVPLRSDSARTGLSEAMSPGDISSLARSADIAFRVRFDSAIPPYNQLYWRALTLDEFDGRRWSRGFPFQPQFLGANARERRDWFEAIDYIGDRYRYNVIVEPSAQNWLYTLQMPRITDSRLFMRSDYQVEAFRRITQRIDYDVESSLSFSAAAGLDFDSERDCVGSGSAGFPASAAARELCRALRLGESGNPAARALADELYAQAGSQQAYIEAVLEHFRSREFFYTLRPGTLGEDAIDGFLFESRQGFCEHYAGAFAFLMRAAGIPARVVTGYMGGEFNPYDGTLTVRQYDAHAWAELWLPGTGWQRYDPTAIIAPERVDQGSDAALQQQEEFMEDEVFTLVRFRNSPWLNRIRYRIEMMDYAWNRFVLNYDRDMQLRFFSSLFGQLNAVKLTLGLAGCGLLFGLLAAWIVLRQRSALPKPGASRLYLALCRRLAKAGCVRQAGETPRRFAERVALQHPQWRDDLERITECYVELAYHHSEPDAQRLRELRSRIRRFRLLM